MTHLRQIMLEELERRNYAPRPRSAPTFAQSSTSPGTFTVRPISLGLEHIRQYQAEMFAT